MSDTVSIAEIPRDWDIQEDLKRRVATTIKTVAHKKLYNKLHRSPLTGQHYAILILQGMVYYTLYLFVEDPWLEKGPTYKAALRRIVLRSNHITIKGTEEFEEKIHEMFRKPTMNKVNEVFPKFDRRYRDRKFAYRELPKEWPRNYDKLLKRGDIVLCRWYFRGVYHAGIYIGNGQVIHRSAGGQFSKCLSFPRRGHLIADFAGKESSRLWVMKFVVTFRSNEDIARAAEKYADEAEINPDAIKEWRLLTNNCQKFVADCATGESGEWKLPIGVNARF